MSKRNGKLPTRHKDALRPSSPDDVALADAVEARFLDLCVAWLRVKGVELTPPQSLDGAVLLWRRMRVRHKQGDFRNSDSELKAVKEVAQWTLDCQCELRNQPKQTLVWKE
jgi:hypothetical protein